MLIYYFTLIIWGLIDMLISAKSTCVCVIIFNSWIWNWIFFFYFFFLNAQTTHRYRCFTFVNCCSWSLSVLYSKWRPGWDDKVNVGMFSFNQSECALSSCISRAEWGVRAENKYTVLRSRSGVNHFQLQTLI